MTISLSAPWTQTRNESHICYNQTITPQSWDDEVENTGQLRYEYRIETPDNKTIRSLHCHLVDETNHLDTTHEFYLEADQPTRYSKDNQQSTHWPSKSALLPIPSEFITANIYEKRFQSLAQQVPTLEQSLHQLASIIDQKYNFNAKE